MKKILILFPEFLGDYHFLIPFLHELKHCYPQSEIHMYTTATIVPLAKHHPSVDHVHDLPNLKVKGTRTWLKILGFGWSLRKQKFDVAYFTNEYMLWVCKAAGVKTIIREHHSLINRLFCKGTPHAKLRDNLRHSMQRHVNNLESIFNYSRAPEDYNLSPGYSDRALPLPKGFNLSDYVVINPDAKTIKNYNKAFYLQLIAYLLEKNLTIVVIGLRDSFDLNETFQNNLNFHYWVGKTNLFEATRLIRDSKIFFGLDSGTAHIASGQYTKSLVFYPPKGAHPSLTGAFYKNSYGYKLKPLKSACDRACKHFPSCPYDDCKTDYIWADVQTMVDTVLLSNGRPWTEKKLEVLDHTINTWTLQSVKGLRYKYFFKYLKEKRIRVVIWEGPSLPLRLKIWHTWLKFSESHYCVIVTQEFLDYSGDDYLLKSYEALKK
jgi:ADP-heptose:LPS heptosyltransferase